MAEMSYQRVSSTGSCRTEIVVVYLPDIWSCVPTATQWEKIVQSYIRPCDDDEPPTVDDVEEATKALPTFITY